MKEKISKRLFYGFRTKLFLFFFPYTFAIIISFALFFLIYMRNTLRNSILKSTDSLFNIASDRIRQAIFFEDSLLIRDLLRDFLKNENILYIAVYSGDTLKKFYEFGNEPKRTHIEGSPYVDCYSCHGKEEKNIFEETVNYFDITFPIIISDKPIPIGFLRVIHSKKEIIELQRRSGFTVLIFSVIFFILGGVISFLLSTLLINPINIFKNKLREIAEGEADLTRKIKLNGRDEFCEMGIFFNEFLEKLRINVSKTLETSEKIKAFSEDISSATEELTASSNEVTGTVQKMASLASETASSVIDASKSVREILELSLSTSEESKEMENLEREALTFAIKGREISEVVMQKLSEMQNDILSLKTNIETLSQMLRGIREITESIQVFMKRTNLLSLNAYIEAARAGEYGKGFAIVAQEIRKLSEDSRSSSIKIQEIVENINQGMQETLVAMKKVNDSLLSSKEIIFETVSQMKKIADQTEETMDRTSKIAKLSHKEREEIEKLARFMDRVGEMAESVSVSSQQIAASMEEQLAAMEEITATVSELGKLGDELRGILGKFKV
ncbi:MAG: methyl-accepting chemotaxis protein [Candidatus Hydrothermales bacterium]